MGDSILQSLLNGILESTSLILYSVIVLFMGGWVCSKIRNWFDLNVPSKDQFIELKLAIECLNNSIISWKQEIGERIAKLEGLLKVKK